MKRIILDFEEFIDKLLQNKWSYYTYLDKVDNKIYQDIKWSNPYCIHKYNGMFSIAIIKIPCSKKCIYILNKKWLSLSKVKFNTCHQLTADNNVPFLSHIDRIIYCIKITVIFLTMYWISAKLLFEITNPKNYSK